MNDFNEFRDKIDQIDEKLRQLVRERMTLIKEIGQIKKEKNLKITDQNREQEILEKAESNYEKAIFQKILEESKKIQRGDC
jgi:chorismate mutase